jgi:hypothetical protein
MSLSSHASDGNVGATLAMMRCHCRVMLAMSLSRLTGDAAAEAMLNMARCRVMLVMQLSSQCCLWRDVDAESCWRQCCRVMLVTAMVRLLGRGTMWRSSHTDDSVAESCW